MIKRFLLLSIGTGDAKSEGNNLCYCTLSHSLLPFLPLIPLSLPLLPSPQASRVDKLQAELTAQREKVEEGGRMQSRLKELKSRNDQILEAKAMLEDEVDNLQSKVTLLETLKSEAAQMKVQIDTLNNVRKINAPNPLTHMYCTITNVHVDLNIFTCTCTFIHVHVLVGIVCSILSCVINFIYRIILRIKHVFRS